MAICRFTFSSGPRAIRSSDKFVLDGGRRPKRFPFGVSHDAPKAGEGGTTPMIPPGSTPEPVLVLSNYTLGLEWLFSEIVAVPWWWRCVWWWQWCLHNISL